MAAHHQLRFDIPRRLCLRRRLPPNLRLFTCFPVAQHHQQLSHPLQTTHARPRACVVPAPGGPMSTGGALMVVPSTRRGKRTKTIIKLEDLPQGPIASLDQPVLAAAPRKEQEEGEEEETEEGEEEEEGLDESSGEVTQDDGKPNTEPRYPTVLTQVRQNMDKLPTCVLLTRIGGFYELYFEHADEYAPLLNIKVAQRKTNGGPVSMAGFPFYQLDRFLKVLVQDLSRSVAIAEEFPNDPSAKVRSGGLRHDRKISRVITPGTLIDENFLDAYANSYVLSIHLSTQETEGQCVGLGEEDEPISTSPPPPDPSLGLAWMDLSTGHFYLQTCPLSSLQSVLSRICPKEVIIDQTLETHEGSDLVSLLSDGQHLITYSPRGPHIDPADWTPILESPVSDSVLQSVTPTEVDAGNLLLHYVKDRLRGMNIKLQPPLRYENMHIMVIDKNTMHALEIKQTIQDNLFRGSLLHAIRRTVTKGGARLLNEWLSAPSTSLDVITQRQDLVEHFLEDENLRQEVIYLLKRSHDSQRLVQKFALGRGDSDDLLSLSSTIYSTENIYAIVKNAAATALEDGHMETNPSSEPPRASCLESLISRINLTAPLKLARRIKNSIDQEGVESQQRAQDQEAGAILALAEEVVTAQGSGDDAAAVLPKRSAANPNGKAGKVAAAETPRKKKVPNGTTQSIRDHYAGDKEAWTMKPDASATLSKLHHELGRLAAKKEALEDSLRERLHAATLTLKWTPTLGHICHVRGRDAKALSPSTAAASKTAKRRKSLAATLAEEEHQDHLVTTLVSSSRSTSSLQVPEWTALGTKLDQVRIRIRAEEAHIFSALREAVVHNLILLRRNGAVLEEMDVAAAFALLAREQHLVRPLLRDNPSVGHNIIGGRHPTVEGGLVEQGRSFVGNDCFVGSGSGGAQQTQNHGLIWLITGPNMAGKSTFLRQNALITILAQVGCFVPADFAEIGLVDAIFSRVGSADSLYHSQSTFMVEMLETAAILRNATPRSFVIMDEVGRGTSPGDGTAVAYACLHHLATVNKCRSLFATHFHDIANLVSKAGLDVASGGPVDMYCTNVEENQETGEFIYIHRLRKGVNGQSHALKVARLAGLPQRAIDMASKIMDKQAR